MAERLPASAALGRVVRRWRAGRGVSQEELGSLSGLHRTYVGQLERAEKNPTLETVEKLLRGTGMSLSELAEQIEREQERESAFPERTSDDRRAR